MINHRSGLILLPIALLLLSGCSRSAGHTAPPQELDLYAQACNDHARFLAGLAGRPDGPYHSLEDAPAWQKYSADIQTRWTRASSGQFAAVDAFQQREIAPARTGSAFMFYPFSGPDVLYMTRFFPDAPVYVLAGLERVGEIRAGQDFSPRTLERDLNGWRQALSSIFDRTFFVTSEMDSQFHGRVANGLLPMIVLLLARSGYTLTGVRYGHLDSDGSYVEEPAQDRARHPGVEISFHRTGQGREQKLYYFSTNLGPDFETNPAFFRFLARLGRPDTLVKSASFLLHWDMCAGLRRYILDHSTLILEDDTGVPYRFFQNAGWQVQLFGEYSRPDRPFHRQYQPDLAKAFENPEAVKPLGFSLGYGSGRRPSSMILAKRQGLTASLTKR